tara:strand:+ start:2841 stop:3257 length:417 start_codon:yes stop_codon:yes gene_type:complete
MPRSLSAKRPSATLTRRLRFPADSVAARELQLVIENDYQLHRSQELPIQKNAMRRMIKGTFNPEQAVKLWGYLVTSGATKYRKEFGGGPETFNPRTRELVARRMSRDFADSVRRGYISPNDLGLTGKIVHAKFGPKEN